MRAAARGELRAAMATSRIEGARLPTLPGAAVAIVLAAHGYPDRPRTGDPIGGLSEAAATGALIFHAGTTRDPDGTVRTAGGRVLSVVGRGADLAAAHESAMTAADWIQAPGLQRRRDIAREPVASLSGGRP